MANADFPWRLLGELLVAKGLIGADELEWALDEQRRSKRRLGEILVARGGLTGSELMAVLAEQYGVDIPSAPVESEPVAEWQPLGRLLVAQGAIEQSALDEALATQRETGRRLGDILVGSHGVSMLALAATLGAQHGVAGGRSRGARPSNPDDSAYEVVEPGNEPLFRTDSFLEATDFAFEYREAESPVSLEILRVRGGEGERVWLYDRDAAGEPTDLVKVFGFRPHEWTGPPRRGGQTRLRG